MARVTFHTVAKILSSGSWEDVLIAIRENFAQVSDQSKVFLQDFQWGDLERCVLGQNPEVFSAFSGLSSITSFDEMKHFVEEPFHCYAEEPTQYDVLDQILANREKVRPFRFDCGSEDLLIEYNRTLHEKLTAEGIAHDYQEHPGSQEWPYWEKHISETYAFFNQLI